MIYVPDEQQHRLSLLTILFDADITLHVEKMAVYNATECYGYRISTQLCMREKGIWVRILTAVTEKGQETEINKNIWLFQVIL